MKILISIVAFLFPKMAAFIKHPEAEIEPSYIYEALREMGADLRPSALWNAFHWAESPQGHEFWSDVANLEAGYFHRLKAVLLLRVLAILTR
jgi:hypothetical protein